MKEILNNARKEVEQAEVYKIRAIEFPIQFKANKFRTAERKVYDGVGLRVIHKGRIGFAHTTKLEAAGAIIGFAKTASKFGERARFAFPERGKYPSVRIESDRARNITADEIKEDCHAFIQAVLKEEKDVKIDLDYRKGETTVHIGNTSGLDMQYEKTFTSIMATVFFIANGSFIHLLKYNTSCGRERFYKYDVRDIVKQIEYAKTVVPVESKPMSVIFMRHAMTIPLRAICLGISGKSIQKGISPLKEKKNRKVLDKRITICDDPLLDYGVRTRPCDGEGTASRKLTIFNKGVLKHFIFDLATAAEVGEKSTGNGSREFNEMPQPRISNLVVSPGKWSLAEMVRDIKDGIIVHLPIGGGQSNMLAGDFSFNVSLGFRIKNGRIIGRVKNTMIAGNTYDIMKSIVGIGKKVMQIGNFYTPPFYFKDVNVVSG